MEAPAEEGSLILDEAVTQEESDIGPKIETPGSPGDVVDKTEEDQPATGLEMRVRVSSRHLILASLYFKAALSGPWKEAAGASADSPREVDACDWDPEAFLILMNIIHGRNRAVPRVVSLELLAKIAVVSDYYKCHEAVEVFSELWIEGLKRKHALPTQVDKELALWLCVSWVFHDPGVYTSVTSTAIRESQGPIPTFGLPISEKIVGKEARAALLTQSLTSSTETIDRQRQGFIHQISTMLHNLAVSIRDGPECSFRCSSMQLGALTKGMHAKGLGPRPESPLRGRSVTDMMEAARSIRSPGSDCYGGHYARASQPCDIVSRIKLELDVLEAKIRGLTLGGFDSVSLTAPSQRTTVLEESGCESVVIKRSAKKKKGKK